MTGDVLILISLYAVWKVESISPFKMLFDLFWGFFLAFPFFLFKLGVGGSLTPEDFLCDQTPMRRHSTFSFQLTQSANCQSSSDAPGAA